ncbi:PilZ domain-containing protein [Microvirga rosea]|uniref:PilZ domain-containing protein n=1 Tax=Microvirga rosea TaxID=2715425 RepID=UPI001D0BB5E1|nr:PilZ domain-containing protein [Microvirga rosea]
MVAAVRQVSSDRYREQRRSRRIRVRQPAKIVLDHDTMIHCEVHNISTGGAKLDLGPIGPLPETFTIYIAGYSMMIHEARVRWRKGNYVGISFES